MRPGHAGGAGLGRAGGGLEPARVPVARHLVLGVHPREVVTAGPLLRGRMDMRILIGFPWLAFLTQNLAAVWTGDPRHHRVVQASSMILHAPFKAVSV